MTQYTSDTRNSSAETATSDGFYFDTCPQLCLNISKKKCRVHYYMERTKIHSMHMTFWED